ncbi:MAG: hypothetical protein ACREU9_09565 [Gammaproteobacteria bacterium]
MDLHAADAGKYRRPLRDEPRDTKTLKNVVTARDIGTKTWLGGILVAVSIINCTVRAGYVSTGRCDKEWIKRVYENYNFAVFAGASGWPRDSRYDTMTQSL